MPGAPKPRIILLSTEAFGGAHPAWGSPIYSPGWQKRIAKRRLGILPIFAGNELSFPSTDAEHESKWALWPHHYSILVRSESSMRQLRYYRFSQNHTISACLEVGSTKLSYLENMFSFYLADFDRKRTEGFTNRRYLDQDRELSMLLKALWYSLFENSLDRPSSFLYISLYSPGQHKIWIALNKHLNLEVLVLWKGRHAKISL
jgi:hypothetical protein